MGWVSDSALGIHNFKVHFSDKIRGGLLFWYSPKMSRKIHFSHVGYQILPFREKKKKKKKNEIGGGGNAQLTCPYICECCQSSRYCQIINLWNKSGQYRNSSEMLRQAGWSSGVMIPDVSCHLTVYHHHGSLSWKEITQPDEASWLSCDTVAIKNR